MTTYIAFLRSGPDGACTVSFPDLPGCTVCGANTVLATALAGDELVRYLSVLLSLGEAAPPPTPEAALAQDPFRGDAALLAVDVDLEMLGIAHPLHFHTL